MAMAENMNEYHMRHQRFGGSRGRVIIFSNYEFNIVQLGERYVISDKDEQECRMNKLRDAFKYVGFEINQIEWHYNRTAKEMVDTLEFASADSYQGCKDCVIVVVMSLGDESLLYGTDMGLSYKNLMEPLRLKTMEGVPKILIVQATDIKLTGEGHQPGKWRSDAQGNPETLPIHKVSDMLMYYAFIDGQAFVNAFCEVWGEDGKQLEILEIFRRVTRLLTYLPDGSKRPSPSYRCPSTVSLLTKSLYFR